MCRKLPKDLAAAVRLGAIPQVVMLVRVPSAGQNVLEIAMSVNDSPWHVVARLSGGRINGPVVYTAIKDRGWPLRSLVSDNCSDDFDQVFAAMTGGEQCMI